MITITVNKIKINNDELHAHVYPRSRSADLCLQRHYPCLIVLNVSSSGLHHTKSLNHASCFYCVREWESTALMAAISTSIQTFLSCQSRPDFMYCLIVVWLSKTWYWLCKIIPISLRLLDNTWQAMCEFTSWKQLWAWDNKHTCAWIGWMDG